MGTKRGPYAKTFKYAKKRVPPTVDPLAFYLQQDGILLEWYEGLGECLRTEGLNSDEAKWITFRRDMVESVLRARAFPVLAKRKRLTWAEAQKLMKRLSAAAALLLEFVGEPYRHQIEPEYYTTENGARLVVYSSLVDFIDKQNRESSQCLERVGGMLQNFPGYLHILHSALQAPSHSMAEGYFIDRKKGRPINYYRALVMQDLLVRFNKTLGCVPNKTDEKVHIFTKPISRLFSISQSDTKKYILSYVERFNAGNKTDIENCFIPDSEL